MSDNQGPSGAQVLNIVAAIVSAYGARKLMARRKQAQGQVPPYVDALLRIREAGRREEEAQPTDLEAAAMRARHNQEYSTLVSNIAQLKHQAAMGIIGNMKPQGRG
jgi:hypothetical protein